MAGLALAFVAVFAGGAAADRSGFFGPQTTGPGGQAANANPAGNPDPSSGASKLALIQQAWNLLHTQYVGRADLDDMKLAYGAIEGMTNAVGDTGHTSFETPEDLAQEKASLSGSYVGIGALVDVVDGVPTIEGVFPNSPAVEQGLKEGDQIIAVDGTPTSGLSVDDVTAHVRGPAGTKVTLTIHSKGTTGNRDVSLVRRSVDLPVVEWAMVPGTTVADIRLDQFSSGATDKLVAALKAATKAGATSVLLDLRHNPGGFVDEARGVASQFLASGLVYQEEDAAGKKTPVPVRGGGVATTIPLVLLVDKETASAAEIVAGALHDAGRAKLVGETTFGTGTVLGQFTLADGSALRIGTIQWLTPDGDQIWHHGITPDVSVALPDTANALSPDEVSHDTLAQIESSSDAQLVAGIAQLGVK
jgi:carboxyl-terminal processing protease